MTHTQTLVSHKRILVSLSLTLVAAILMYMGFVLSVVVDTAVRADAERSTGGLTSRIADLEADYLRLSHTLTREQALAAGFVEPFSVTQVSGKPSVSTLTLRAQ